MFIPQTRRFLKSFRERNIPEGFQEVVVRKSLALKAEAKKAGSAYDETPRPPISAGRAS